MTATRVHPRRASAREWRARSRHAHLFAGAVVAACLPCARGARAQEIRVGTPVTVAVSAPDHPLYEPHLAIDPDDPRHLVAASIVAGPATGTFEERRNRQSCAAFLSFDGGATWSRHDFPTTWCFDPWVAITPGGHVLVTVGGAHAAFPRQGRSGLVGFRSDDGGKTWDETPIGLGSGHDHPTMAVDRSSGPRRGWIYLSSHRATRADEGRLRQGLYVARSRNGGKSFDDPVYVIPNDLHNLPEMPVVLNDGTLVASFVDASFYADTGGAALSETDFERRRAWVVRSSDGGFTYSAPSFVNDACGPPPPYGLSALAADVSTGPFAGRLYFACRAKGGGPIVVNYSRDGGESWTAPVALHSATPDPVVNARIPALAVNGRGALLVAWIDAPGGAGHRCEQRVYAAASVDGGRSFSPGRLVSSAAVCPDTTHVASSTGGDYFGLAAAPGGQFRLLWSETTGGVARLRTTTVDVGEKVEHE